MDLKHVVTLFVCVCLVFGYSTSAYITDRQKERLTLTKETATKHVDDAFIVVCKDQRGLPVAWEGPKGRLGPETHPKVHQSFYGTAIIFDRIRSGDTGNYTCTAHGRNKRIFSLKVEDFASSSYISQETVQESENEELALSKETATKHVDDSLIVVCRDQRGLIVAWEGPKGRLGPKTHPKIQQDAMGTSIVFDKIRSGDSGNYTCTADGSNKTRIFRLKVEDIASSSYSSQEIEEERLKEELTLTQETATKHVDDTFIVICKDQRGLPVAWEGPKGRLGPATHPKVQQGSFGTSIVFDKVRSGDTGNYTCTADGCNKTRIFRLKVEDIGSSLYISQETATRHVGDSFIIICKDQRGLPVGWEGPKGILGPKTHPKLRQSSYGTAIIFDKVRSGDTGNYTCTADGSNMTRIFRLKVEDVASSSYIFQETGQERLKEVLTLTQETATKHVDDTFIVSCRDQRGLPVMWKGPKGLLGSKTHPKVQHGSSGSSIFFDKIRSEDTGNYTCASGGRNNIRIFKLKVEAIASSLYISQETATRHVNDSIIIICKDERGLPVAWEGPKGRLGPKTHPKVRQSSYGTAIIFDKVRSGDTGNYTCTADGSNNTRIFSLKVEASQNTKQVNILSELETIVKSNDNFTVICQGKKPLKWTVPEVTGDKSIWTTVITEFERPNSGDFEYGSRLTIINITYPFVGFYYCHHEDANKTSETESDKIYLYVNDEDHLSILERGDINETVVVPRYQNAIIPCKPTSPDVQVVLTLLNGKEVPLDSANEIQTLYRYEPMYGFFTNDTKENDKDVLFNCSFTRGNVSHYAYVHMIVENQEHLSILEGGDINETVVVPNTIIPCKPTLPGDHVVLSLLDRREVPFDSANEIQTLYHYEPMYGFSTNDTKENDKDVLFNCSFTRGNISHYAYVHMIVEKLDSNLAKPDIKDTSKGHTVIGDLLILQCIIKTSTSIEFHWTTPNGQVDNSRMNTSNQVKIKNGRILQTLTIYDTTLEDQGLYLCNVTDFQNHSSSTALEVKISGQQF